MPEGSTRRRNVVAPIEEKVDEGDVGRVMGLVANSVHDVQVLSKSDYFVPKTFRDILNIKDIEEKEAWLEAHYTEIEAIESRGTWERTTLPPGKKCLRSMFIYDVKLNPDGTLRRRKARLVADGSRQIAGVDYANIYAPVVGIDTIRIIIALSTKHKWIVYQMDVTNAFLYADEDGSIYINQPEGDIRGDPRIIKCRLWKSLYGTCQAPKLWNEEIDRTFTKFGLQRSIVDRCLYYMRQGEQIVIVLLYVDDIIITGNWSTKVKEFRRHLSTTYEVKDLGELAHCLGFVVQRDPELNQQTISQAHYVDRLLQKFKMTEAKAASTPGPADADKQVQAWIASTERPKATCCPYRELLGGLLYLAIVSRPDIANQVRWLSRFANKYEEIHWTMLKKVLRYLKGSRDYALTYDVDAPDIEVYADASYACDYDSGRSVTGYVVKLYGAAVSWKSRTQTTVAKSTMEAEYMALSDTVTEVGVLQQLLSEIGFPLRLPVVIFGDNQAALSIGSSEAATKRSRHINVRFHNVREQVTRGMVELRYVRTDLQVADILTKNLGAVKLQQFRRGLGLVKLGGVSEIAESGNKYSTDPLDPRKPPNLI